MSSVRLVKISFLKLNYASYIYNFFTWIISRLFLHILEEDELTEEVEDVIGVLKDPVDDIEDVNEELEDMVRRYIVEANLEDIIDYRVGNAIEIIPTINDLFDLVFIDADKENYIKYFNLVSERLNNNGIIINEPDIPNILPNPGGNIS